AHDVFAHLLVEFPAVLDYLDELRLPAIVVEHKDSTGIGKMQTWRDQRTRRLFLFSFCPLLCVGLLEFVSAQGRIQPARIFFVEFVGSVAIDKTRGKVFPVVALSAVVMDTIALDFPPRGELVRTVFQDQSLGMLLCAQTRRQDQRKPNAECRNESLAHISKD